MLTKKPPDQAEKSDEKRSTQCVYINATSVVIVARCWPSALNDQRGELTRIHLECQAQVGFIRCRLEDRWNDIGTLMKWYQQVDDVTLATLQAICGAQGG